jgi:hypothetical protein
MAPIGRDHRRAAVVVTLADDLKGELGLSGVHGEDGEVVDGEQLGADVATEGFLERAVKLGGVELVEHLGGGDEHDTAGHLAGFVGQGARKEGLAGTRRADEERVDALLEEGQIVKPEVARAHLLAAGGEIEVEAVNGVDLRRTAGHTA